MKTKHLGIGIVFIQTVIMEYNFYSIKDVKFINFLAKFILTFT